MKKTVTFVFLILILIAFTACTHQTDVAIDYGSSQIYSDEEMEEVVKVILSESKHHNIKKISYVSDAENIKQYDICVKKGYDNYSECICFHVEFYIDGERIISNGWTLARTQNGRWKSVFSPW